MTRTSGDDSRSRHAVAAAGSTERARTAPEKTVVISQPGGRTPRMVTPDEPWSSPRCWTPIVACPSAISRPTGTPGSARTSLPASSSRRPQRSSRSSSPSPLGPVEYPIRSADSMTCRRVSVVEMSGLAAPWATATTASERKSGWTLSGARSPSRSSASIAVEARTTRSASAPDRIRRATSTPPSEVRVTGGRPGRAPGATRSPRTRLVAIEDSRDNGGTPPIYGGAARIGSRFRTAEAPCPAPRSRASLLASRARGLPRSWWRGPAGARRERSGRPAPPRARRPGHDDSHPEAFAPTGRPGRMSSDWSQ